jgi:hypothetical protein
MNSKPCLCFYPCKNENCPKEKGTMCLVNHCEVVAKYSELTHKKNYCSVCGRGLNSDSDKAR